MIWTICVLNGFVMNKFPKTVMGFYLKNFWRYGGVAVMLYAMFAFIDLAGVTLLPSFALKRAVSVLESVPAAAAVAAILPVALVYLGLRFVQWSASIMRWVVFDNMFRYKAYNKMSADLYDYVFAQSVDFYTASMPGKIASQISQIIDAHRDLVNIVIGELCAMGVSIFIAGVGLFQIGWQYLALISVAAAFRVVWGCATVRPTLRATANRARALNSLQGRLLDALSNFMVVKLFARAKYEQSVVMPARRHYEKTARYAHFKSRFFWGPGNLFMDAVCFSGLIVLCGYMYQTGQSTLADVSFALAIFDAVSSMTFSIIMQLRTLVDSYGNAVGSYNSLIRPIRITDAPGAPRLRVSRGQIDIRNVSFGYGNNTVLDDLSLTIAPGEKVGLVGVSGAGKTTLVNLLLRMYGPRSGGIYIDGQNIADVTQDSLRESISFIPQEPTMFNRTLRDNIAYGRIDASDADIRRAARAAHADGFIMNSAEKYETLVGDRGIKLSGGQRQRIAIARAFLKDAPILVLDEATAALDSETEASIQQSFEKLSQGRTTIVIAHRLSTLRNMDRIVVIDHGKIVESGTHNSLVRRACGIYAHLWQMQSGGFIGE